MAHAVKDRREAYRRGFKKSRLPDKAWRRSVLSAVRGIEAVYDDGSEIAAKWIRGVQRHYRERLKWLLLNPPPRCRDEAGRLFRRVRRVYHLDEP
jgi:hypothetical protein